MVIKCSKDSEGLGGRNNDRVNSQVLGEAGWLQEEEAAGREWRRWEVPGVARPWIAIRCEKRQRVPVCKARGARLPFRDAGNARGEAGFLQ